MKELISRLFRKQGGEPSGSLLERIPQIDTKEIPGYLSYPSDPLSRVIFSSKLCEAYNSSCRYRFLLNTDIADPHPETRQQKPIPGIRINNTQIFWKAGSPSCYSVSTMEGPSVKSSSLTGWVESGDNLGMLFDNMLPFLNLPIGFASEEYRRVKMYKLPECAAYNRSHFFEESCVYCHVFYLGDALYKKFILCVKRGTSSWKVECTFPSDSEALQPTDTVPPGQVFGSFFPMDA